MAVFVLDKRKKPLMPCSEKRARKLLESGRARVHRLIPFAIRLVDRHVGESELQSLPIKLDPGSRTTGMALVGKSEAVTETGEVMATAHVLSLFELLHRGQQISKALTSRRSRRRRRRSALRYRMPQFLNRANKASGRLAPSLKHRVETTAAWVDRLRHPAPVTHIAQELVRFDTQQLENPRISGIEYQQGTLAGYEIREYLLEKWGQACAYCGAKAIPLQIAVCVGVTPAVTDWCKPTLAIRATGRGRYQRSRLDRFGFPRGYLTWQKRIKGFQTGDRVIARVTTGKKAGIYVGRVAVRTSGSFNIQTADGVVQGIAHRHCRVVQRADGYSYSQRAATSKATTTAPSPLDLPALKGGVSRGS